MKKKLRDLVQFLGAILVILWWDGSLDSKDFKALLLSVAVFGLVSFLWWLFEDTEPKRTQLEVTWRGVDYQASFPNESGKWEADKNPYTALGQLVHNHQERLGLEINMRGTPPLESGVPTWQESMRSPDL